MADNEVSTRGLLKFQIGAKGNLLNSATNVELLRQLWLDRDQVQGESLGPGDPGDFDYGAWHVACHLVAAAGVLQDEDNRFLWLEVSYDVGCDQYFPSMTWRSALSSQTIPLDSAEARGLLPGAKLLGFIEGNSTGRTSARRVYDGPARFNLWRRQDFDQPVDATDDGGKVWEHWCMLRDIRPSSSIGTSVLTAYVSLLSVLGDRFAAAVARGRRDYGHPRQLCEMVCAGLVAEAAALWDTKPVAIPAEFESRLMSAEPVRCVQVCEAMDWKDPPRYYMFQRRIDHWNDADNVRRELELFRKPDGR